MAMPIQLNNILNDLQKLGDPLMVYLLPGSNQPITVTPQGDNTASNQQKVGNKPSSSAVTTSAAPAPSTYLQVSSAAPTSSPSSSSEEAKPTHGSNDNSSSGSSGGIPDGQGNSFNTPSGAVRFPWNHNNADNVVPITPQSLNGGWAMSPDQSCKPGGWCPYACAPGYYSAQWDPSASAYNGAGSMNGGLKADANGKLSKPFPDRPFCESGMMNAHIENKLGQSVSACQTVYPGNEAMIIPSVASAGGSVQLNVVPKSYWLGVSSQFYVNLAGSDASQCIWGNDDKPIGNWAPYIFGGGQAADGNTYISVQFNPLYTSKGFKVSDAYNVRIECTSGKCNFPNSGECKCEGGKCSVDNGCTVTLPQGAQAKWVLY
ncbi:hypothetical protein DL89DRAFT_294502 [Linderina pennispora]|uniref:SUN-domain-containing protein n=1 Tax=Linderina pennispora TaxID=61395 RepID=A0A1Y1W417_9FUNG|nr:uncharacterized protein DL89DRAFT_294502 [Linderina pennispora]ORX67976.1 hypothetical protein DL89DRAFT_294502 [Linderina pennispora]